MRIGSASVFSGLSDLNMRVYPRVVKQKAWFHFFALKIPI